jgi:hypothetical protein
MRNIFWQPLVLRLLVFPMRGLDRYRKDCVVEQALRRIFTYVPGFIKEGKCLS